ncbi:minor capsid protein [Bacillaceae bacterium Marseille-Q3522]|nr:minor capsid protein [Bacillaceae bacterium Marseille-Q3522]
MAEKKDKLSYWERRFLQINLDQEKKDLQYAARIRRLYAEFEKFIQAELERFYKRYAINDKITPEEARKLLSKAEQENWRMTLKEFRRKALEGGYEPELNREYYRSRVSRLQQLETQAKMHLMELAAEEEKQLHDHLTDAFQETYLRNVYEIQNAIGRTAVTTSFAMYDQKEIDIILNKPWQGGNFSKRVWKNDTKRLPDELEKILHSGVMMGHSIDKMASQFTKRFDVAKNRAVTLVQTETTFITETATFESYKETGVEKYRYEATLETHTCPECASLDQKVFDVKDKVVGQNAPPMHPNCRCTSIPYFDDEFTSNEMRWSRDPVTGKGKLVPKQTFTEWKKGQMENIGQDSWKSVETATKNRRVDSEQYKRYRDVLGNKVPGSLEAFRDLKYNNSEEWSKIKDNYYIKSRLKEGSYRLTFNPEKQAPHMESTREVGKSYFYNNVDIQKLINDYAGTGKVERDSKQRRTNREVIWLDGKIGKSISLSGEKEANGIKIHYSKNRTHVVPIRKDG